MKSIITLILTILIFTSDTTSEIYSHGEFIFSLKIFKNNKKINLKFNTPHYLTYGENKVYENAWELGNAEGVVFLGLEILEGTINNGQKTIKWNYYDSKFNKITEEITGLIENDSLIWFHPPRTKYFKILEINPFPEIRLNEEKWSTKLKIGEHWGNKRWKTWKGNIIISTDYKYNKNIGKVTAIGNSKLGTTYLVTEFDKINGLKKMDYTNIDGSRIVLELIERKD